MFESRRGKPVVVPSEVASAAERPYRAYKKKLDGMTWADIAQEEGYPNQQAAAVDVRKYLEQGKALVTDYSRQQLIEIEADRLDKLQRAIWGLAMQGDLPAVAMSLKIMAHRAKILGLEADQRAGETSDARPVTIVVAPDSESYMAALERMATVAEGS